jgi:hypothetical protein
MVEVPASASPTVAMPCGIPRRTSSGGRSERLRLERESCFQLVFVAFFVVLAIGLAT